MTMTRLPTINLLTGAIRQDARRSSLTRMVVGATLATCALAALTYPGMATATAGVEQLVASDFQTNRYVAPVIDSFGGVTVFSETDQTKATYHLAAVVGDRRARLPIEPRQRVPFDVDLGSDGKGGVVAAYSRCRIEPASSRASLYAQPYPAWTTARGCDLYRYDFSGRERKITGASTSGASEMLPSIWKGDVAFARV